MTARTIISTFFMLTALSSNSATKTWDGGGSDNDWLTAANWDLDVVPSAGDDLVFTGVGSSDSQQ